MQAVYDNSARPGILLQFARRRDYMMRSEKRNGYNYSGSPSRKPPKRRRKKAGFFYILIALLLSVAFWPLGMIMLWRRKVRWKVTSKLLTSIITLFLCVVLIGFGLTVQTDNPTVTKVQDKVNDFLDHSAEYLAESYAFLCERGEMGYSAALDLGDAVVRTAPLYAAEGLEEVSALAEQARELVGLNSIEDISVEPSIAPVITDAPTDAPTKAPTHAPTNAPTDVPTDTPTDAPTDTPETAAPAETSKALFPITLPEETPDPASAKPLGNGSIGQDRELATDAPTATPEPTEEVVWQPTGTPEATAEPVVAASLLPKPAGEAVVYYNSNGVNYHMRSSCKNMSSASAGTLADAVERGLRRCQNCQTPEDTILKEENVVWIDDNSLFHLSDDCAEFVGEWKLMNLSEALSEGNLPCAACQAGLYMAACGEAIPTPVPTPTPTPTPIPTPSPTPAPVYVTPAYALKPAGEALVYHSSNGKWYHTEPDCSGMGGASLYPLSECAHTHKRCRTCEAPLPELLEEHCLWQDADKLCHTSDDCPAFNGKYTLVIRDEALENAMTGCVVCGADEYLVPNSIIDYEAIAAAAVFTAATETPAVG